jgi:uncharacterized membrane protein
MMIGCVLGWLIALKFTHEKPLQSMQEHRHQRDRQRRQKQLIAQTLRALLLLFIAALMIATEAHAILGAVRSDFPDWRRCLSTDGAVGR